MSSFISKIKEFFNRIFSKNDIKLIQEKNEEIKLQENESILSTSNFRDDLIISTNVNNESIKCKEIANKIFSEEIDCYDLTDEEADEMIDYFKYDINEKEKELQRIKNNILRIKNKLNNQNA